VQLNIRGPDEWGMAFGFQPQVRIEDDWHINWMETLFDSKWLENLGFAVIDVQSPAAYRSLFQKQLWGVGVTGKRIKGEGSTLVSDLSPKAK
jgi:hypothetical protein